MSFFDDIPPSAPIKEKKAVPTAGRDQVTRSRIVQQKQSDIEDRVRMMQREFDQIKTYLRKGTRPSQKMAIENFEKNLEELMKK